MAGKTCLAAFQISLLVHHYHTGVTCARSPGVHHAELEAAHEVELAATG